MKTKKLVGLVLGLCTMLTAFCSLPVGAAADYGLIVNGGFDVADEENELLPQGWDFDGDAAWIDNSYASIPIVGTGTFIKQFVYPLSGEAITGVYTLTFRYKLSADNAAEVYGYTYYAEEDTDATKAFRTNLPATTSASDDWVEFSLKTAAPTAGKTVAYMTLIFRGLSEVENCTLCVDDVALHKDYNLLANSAFSSTTGWKLGSGKTYNESTEKYDVDATNDKTVLAKFLRDDGACPEGDTYIQFDDTNLTNGIYNPYVVTNSDGFSEGMTFASGTRYQFSVWYKSTASKDAVRIYIPMSGKASDATWTSNDYAYIFLPATNGEWKKTVITFEQLPDCTGFNVGMRAYAATLANGQYVAFNNPQLVALKESDCGLGMYDATGMGFVSSYEGGAAYANILGEPLTSLKGCTGTVSAVYSSLSGTTAANDEAVVLAVYEKDGDGVKRLTDVRIEDADVPASGDAYPTASLNLENVSAGSEVRAYVWNSISGLQSADNYISFIK